MPDQSTLLGLKFHNHNSTTLAKFHIRKFI